VGTTAQRIMIASERDNIENTVVLRDELPALEQDEIRLRVDKVGLSANNLFYAQMGEAPFLKFFAVYPLGEEHKHLANVPAWGVATIIESRNSEFSVGEQYRGFLHMTNVVQMKARRTDDGLTAYGGKRDKLNPAYNGFVAVDPSGSSPIKGEGDKSDLAMTSAPGGLSGFIMYELLKMHGFYKGNSVVLTSASSKLSLATAMLLQDDRQTGKLEKVIAYTAKSNADFVRSTGLYDEILAYDESLPDEPGLKHVLIDVAGDAAIYKRSKDRFVKAFAVGGTHSNADASIFTAFGLSGFCKMFIDMIAPQAMKSWASRNLNPRLEMFFAPTVITQLLALWGKEAMDQKSDKALGQFVNAAIEEGWIEVDRSENVEDIQAAYKNIVLGQVPPSHAIILSLHNPDH
jgi:NADPH:quinone reductase-like Zn-dependent oxidoreductase